MAWILPYIMYKYKKQLTKIEGWSRDGKVKKYTNKSCTRDNLPQPLYTCFLNIASYRVYGAHAGMDNQYWLPLDFSHMHRVKIKV